MTSLVEIHVPQSHPCFAAHFPEGAIVPGALLMSWIAAQMMRDQFVVTGIKTLKFLEPVTPGQQCVLQVEYRDSSASIILTRSGNVVLKGTVAIKYVDK